MDTKASPSKEEGSNDDEQKAVFAKIHKSSPEWFTEAFTFIISTIKMESHSASVIQKKLESKIDSLENRIVQLEQHEKEQNCVISQLKDDIDNTEAYSRRDNLLIKGMHESPNENIRQKIIEVLEKKLKVPDASQIQFVRFHRLGTPLTSIPMLLFVQDQ